MIANLDPGIVYAACIEVDGVLTPHELSDVFPSRRNASAIARRLRELEPESHVVLACNNPKALEDREYPSWEPFDFIYELQVDEMIRKLQVLDYNYDELIEALDSAEGYLEKQSVKTTICNVLEPLNGDSYEAETSLFIDALKEVIANDKTMLHKYKKLMAERIILKPFHKTSPHHSPFLEALARIEGVDYEDYLSKFKEYYA